MKTSIITLLIFLLSIITYGKEHSPFKLMKKVEKREIIDRTFTESKDFSFIDIKSSDLITGFALSGKVELIDETSLVRVLLITENQEYLIFEYFSLIADKYQYNFKDICEETALLESINPVSLMIIVKNAELYIDDFCYSKELLSMEEISQFSKIKRDKKRVDEEVKIQRINFNNSKKNKTWVAGITEVSLLPFEDKRKSFDDQYDFLSGGFEYYTEGIFSLEDFDPLNTNHLKSVNSTYVSEFDWRDRHGQNWDTPIKDQGTCGACFAFSAVAATEIMTNIYHNNHIDLDLSEQHLISCCVLCGACSAGSVWKSMEYIRDTSICDEECFPYAEYAESCDNKCASPDEEVSFANIQTFPNYADDIKSALINYGPLASGYLSGVGHAMALIGYKEIEVGDTIRYINDDFGTDSIIGQGNPLIGETYWIFKNQWGSDFGINGYFYAFLSNPRQISPRWAIIPPVTTTNTYSRNCTDNDGDGYYWWGIGDKPSSCPDCCPEDPDGDDSNANAGPMDSYGNLQYISAPYTFPATNVTNNETWSSTTHVCGDLNVLSSAVLTITATAYLHDNNVTIDGDSEIIINGGSIEQGAVTVEDGSALTLNNNGTIALPDNGSFTIEEGATLEFNYGSIDIDN